MLRSLTLALAALLVAHGPASAGEPKAAAVGEKIVSLRVLPGAVKLEHQRDFQRVVVLAQRADGVTIDVTSSAKLTLAPAGLARLDGDRLRPVKDGAARLSVTHAGLSAAVPVAVSKAATPPRIEFTRHVLPWLTKGGCNSGGCHGQASGKDGFHLSLFGYDPRGDYRRVTREQIGRRIDLARPSDSLLLTKAAGQVAHSGGGPLPKGSPGYVALQRWLAAGAPGDPAKAATLAGLEIAPGELLLESGARARLVVRARYSDGSDRDVSALATFYSTDDVVAAVDGAGEIKAGKRGEAFVLARFDTMTVRCQVLVIPPKLDFSYPKEPEGHYIDKLVGDKLRKLRMAPSGLCDDRTYQRRVTLDLAGRLPTAEERARFLADKAPGARERLADRLLAGKGFTDLMVLYWAERLQIRSVNNRVSVKQALLYHGWLRRQFERKTPFDAVVRELITADGSTFNNPPTAFFYGEPDIKKLAENTAQVFMGTRIQCAQCHNHPFDRWTQQDYYGWAAFFSQTGRKRGPDPREFVLFNRGRGEVPHPVTRRPVPPTYLGGGAANLRGGADRRQALAAWLTSEDNPYFARNLANILWAHFFGTGIVHPVDDVRMSNPPSNPALLDALAEKVRGSRYDLRQLARDIVTSRAYQRSTQTNPSNAGDLRNFARAHLRRIRAEVLLDCITQITGAVPKFQGLPRGAKAIEIADGSTSTYFLTTFGRPKRETVCACELRLEPTLSQALHLLNGDTVFRGIQQAKTVERLLARYKTPEATVDAMVELCFNRPARPKERAALQAQLAGAKDKTAFLRDLLWALLNSREFVFNH